jgi:Mrp family chromosome partitioning ATPase
MENRLETVDKPIAIAERNARTSGFHEAAEEWEENLAHQAGHGSHRNLPGAASFKSNPGVAAIERPALRHLDGTKIDENVVLARHLSRQQEKDLHFIIQRYRLLCNRVLEVAKNTRSQVFLIASALAEEGKTLTSANLAYGLSGVERKRTLLIDLDLRRYTLHSVLGVPPAPNEPLFLEAEDWRTCLWSLRPNLHALLAMKPAENPDELFHSSAMINLIAQARKEYDLILIDSAPLLLAADTHALIPLIDQALLVVRADHTPINCSQDALKILGDKAVGCILNDVKRLKYQAYYNGYYGTTSEQ